MAQPQSALRQMPTQSAEPFVRSYNPFNPAFRDTVRSGINELIGGREMGGTPTQRYRAGMADLLTGAVDLAPGIGDAVGVADTMQAARGGNYGTAAILGGATMLGMAPLIGDAASKAVRGAVESRFIDTLPGRNELNYWVDGGQDAVERGFPEEPFILLDKLYIDPQNRGQGAARQVLKEGLQEMAEKYPGMEVRLLAEPLDRSTNQSDLVRLYESVGFDVDNFQDGMSSIPMSMRLPSRPPASAAPSPLEGTLGKASKAADDLAALTARTPLDMSQAARMQRAAEGKFVPTTGYHGTSVHKSEGQLFDEFQLFEGDDLTRSVSRSPVGKLGVSIAHQPEVASDFAYQASPTDGEGATIMPLTFRSDKSGTINLSGDETNDEIFGTVVDAWKDGYDAIHFTNYTTPAGTKGSFTLIKDPAQVRSVNAAFDPAKRDSANLLAGAAGATFGLSALRNIQRDEERQPD